MIEVISKLLQTMMEFSSLIYAFAILPLILIFILVENLVENKLIKIITVFIFSILCFIAIPFFILFILVPTLIYYLYAALVYPKRKIHKLLYFLLWFLVFFGHDSLTAMLFYYYGHKYAQVEVYDKALENGLYFGIQKITVDSNDTYVYPMSKVNGPYYEPSLGTFNVAFINYKEKSDNNTNNNKYFKVFIDNRKPYKTKKFLLASKFIKFSNEYRHLIKIYIEGEKDDYCYDIEQGYLRDYPNFKDKCIAKKEISENEISRYEFINCDYYNCSNFKEYKELISKVNFNIFNNVELQYDGFIIDRKTNKIVGSSASIKPSSWILEILYFGRGYYGHDYCGEHLNGYSYICNGQLIKKFFNGEK